MSDKNSQSLAHVENQLKTAYSEDYVGKLARKNMNSAKNSQERFKYASQAIQIEIGRNMLPALSKASQGMANAFGRKDTQRGLQVIAKGLGTLATGLANVELTAADIANFTTDCDGMPMNARKVGALCRQAADSGLIAVSPYPWSVKHYAPVGYEFAPKPIRERKTKKSGDSKKK